MTVLPLFTGLEIGKEILRDSDKKNKISTWYKNGGFEYKLLIPSTPNGELKKLISERTEFLNKKLKIKLIKESSTPLINVLQQYASKI